MTLDNVNAEEDLQWKNYLLGQGLKQTYEYWDDGGEAIGTEVFNLDLEQTPYYVGYVGQH